MKKALTYILKMIDNWKGEPSMKWHRADKELPEVGLKVMWAIPATDKTDYHYFFGYLEYGKETISAEFRQRVNLTNDYYWCYKENIPKPTSKKTNNIISEKIKECAKQEDAPIYRGDEEVDSFVRLSEVLKILEEPLS